MKTDQDGTIQYVGDTALWVAHFRALESERPDALFHDPFAAALVGERGRKIAESMKVTSKYTSWNVVIRTVIIDRFIKQLISEGVDLVLNLGAGLDTRPHRMQLPPDLQWIEVDYPQMIEHKERILAGQPTHCHLQRVRMDLAERSTRQKFFAEVAKRAQKVLVITEGVIPYLTPQQVAELAADLRAHANFRYWIAEYFDPRVYPYMNSRARMQKMRNAPFLFFPADWLGFFRENGWQVKVPSYIGEETLQAGRKVPAPWWSFIFRLFVSAKMAQQYLRFTGYFVYEPVDKPTK